MAFHTYPLERAEALDDPSRYRYCSREELVAAIDPPPDATVVDLGSGTGFYTDDVAPFVERVYAVDVQPGMHERYRERSVPSNVHLVAAAIEAVPLPDGVADVAYSTMTYHEYATPDALAEIGRLLGPGCRHVVADWSAEGNGESGPPTEERFDLERAVDHHREAGFVVDWAEQRPETFLLAATPAGD